MNNKFIKFFTILLLFISVFIFCHEIIHSVIYRYFGCNNIGFGINSVMIYTTCLDYNYISLNTELLAHSMNEIIGYTSITLFIFYYILRFKNG
jgi:hypothetical protein